MFRELKRKTAKLFQKFVHRPKADYSPHQFSPAWSGGRHSFSTDQSSPAWTGGRRSFCKAPIPSKSSAPTLERSHSMAPMRLSSFSAATILHPNMPSSSSSRRFSTGSSPEKRKQKKKNMRPLTNQQKKDMFKGMWRTSGNTWDEAERNGRKIRMNKNLLPVQFINDDWTEKEREEEEKEHRFWVPSHLKWSGVRMGLSMTKVQGEEVKMWPKVGSNVEKGKKTPISNDEITAILKNLKIVEETAISDVHSKASQSSGKLVIEFKKITSN